MPDYPDSRDRPVLPAHLLAPHERKSEKPLSSEELDRWDAEMRPDRFAPKPREWKWGQR